LSYYDEIGAVEEIPEDEEIVVKGKEVEEWLMSSENS
jgi:hypothetical protein